MTRVAIVHITTASVGVTEVGGCVAWRKGRSIATRDTITPEKGSIFVKERIRLTKATKNYDDTCNIICIIRRIPVFDAASAYSTSIISIACITTASSSIATCAFANVVTPS